jgi:hypothetical protein
MVNQQKNRITSGRFSALRRLKTVFRITVREAEIGGDFKEWPEHETTVFHVVMGDCQAFGMNSLIAKQHDIKVERTQRVQLCARPCCNSIRWV